MKTIRLLPIVAALLLAAACSTTPPVPNDGRVTVTFEHPDKFTDVRSSYNLGTDQGCLDDLQQFIERRARTHLADGQRLAVKFTDIDMAGDIQPASARLTDVRLMKAIYIPRLRFSYTLTDAAGQVVRQGEENLADTNYQSRIRTNTGDPLFYEKAMLSDWMSSQLGR